MNIYNPKRPYETPTDQQLAEHTPRAWSDIDPATVRTLNEQLLTTLDARCARLARNGWRYLQAAAILMAASLPANYALSTTFTTGTARLATQISTIAIPVLLNVLGWKTLENERKLWRKTRPLRSWGLGDEPVDLVDDCRSLTVIRRHFDQTYQDPLTAPAWWLSEKHLAVAAGIPTLRPLCTPREIEVAIGLSAKHPGTLREVATLTTAVCN